MRSSFTSAAVLMGAISLASAQTFTDCNPTEKTCPSDPGLGSGNTFTTDFTAVSGTDAPSGWSYATGTSLTYDSSSGAKFAITTKTGAPTMSTTKYIMFGRVSATIKAAAGTGIVSSFILESDDLDEIDWEWLGATDSSVESNFFGKGNTTTYNRALYHDVATPIETWHTYVIDWTKDRINWYIDDVTTPVRTLSYTDSLTAGAAGVGSNYPQTPMMIKMGNWVGCPDASDASIAGTCSWAGGQAVFPGTYTMMVKDVTIQDYGCGGEYTYTDLTGSYTSIKSSGTCGSSDTSSSGSSSAVSSTSTTKGGVFAGTSTTSSTSATGSSTATTSGSSSATTSGSSTKATTLTSSTKTSSSTSSAASATGTNGASSLKSLDYGVMGLGLALGYLVL